MNIWTIIETDYGLVTTQFNSQCLIVKFPSVDLEQYVAEAEYF